MGVVVVGREAPTNSKSTRRTGSSRLIDRPITTPRTAVVRGGRAHHALQQGPGHRQGPLGAAMLGQGHAARRLGQPR